MSTTRALLCELIASRILRRFDEDNPGPQGLLLLANILVYGFDPFQRCPDDVMAEFGNPNLGRTHGYRGRVTALELAIVSNSKMLLSSASCQKVMEAIFEGRIVYTPTTFIDMLPDHYKNKRVFLYEPRRAALLNHYRLQVPRTRNLLEVLQFVILLLLYVGVMEQRDTSRFSALEVAFCVYSSGWILEQLASMLEHGWRVYTQNLWSFLDVTFAAIYIIYFVKRIDGHYTDDEEKRLNAVNEAFDYLAMAAPVLVPRLAFNLLSENMLFISLREMMSNFAVLMGLAVWCFLGFFLSLMWMGGKPHTAAVISKWMLWIWFGLDGTGIEESPGFHPRLGPILMILFAFLGNTLFLTILVSMLSNTFSNIVANANAEIQYRRAVMTFEGVKSDAISSFFPPFNILALVLFLPLKALLSPRWFHKVIVLTIRAINAPVLLIIALYERHALRNPDRYRRPSRPNRKGRLGLWDFSKIAAQADTEIVFFAHPPPETLPDPPETGELRPAQDEQQQQAQRAQQVQQQAQHPPPPAPPSVPAPNKVLVRTTSGGLRKESVVGPFGELAEYLHHALEEYGGLGANNPKLHALEHSVGKMEAKLAKICDALDDAVFDGEAESRRGSEAPSRRGSDAPSRRGSEAPSRRGSEAPSRRGSEAPSERAERRGSDIQPAGRRESGASDLPFRRSSSLPPSRRLSEIFVRRGSEGPSRRSSQASERRGSEMPSPIQE